MASFSRTRSSMPDSFSDPRLHGQPKAPTQLVISQVRFIYHPTWRGSAAHPGQQRCTSRRTPALPPPHTNPTNLGPAHPLQPSAPECISLLGECIDLALQARHPALKLAAGQQHGQLGCGVRRHCKCAAEAPRLGPGFRASAVFRWRLRPSLRQCMRSDKPAPTAHPIASPLQAHCKPHQLL